MSTVAPRRPRRRMSAQSLFDDHLGRDPAVPSVLPAPHKAPTASGGGRLTLEQRLVGVWEGLLDAGEVSCPVCSGRLVGRQGGGTCATCGARVE